MDQSVWRLSGFERRFFEVQEETFVNYDPSLAGDAQEGNSSSPVTAHQYLNLEFSNANNFYAGMKISYEYKDLIALSAAGTYRNWDAKEKYSLYMKPACEINFSADFRPITGLNINLGYDYIGRTKVEALKPQQSATCMPEPAIMCSKEYPCMPGLIISSIRNTSIIWAILQKVLTSWED